MAFKSSRWNQYPGIAGLIYGELKDYGRYKMGFEEQSICLHKVYSYYRGILPERELSEDTDLEEISKLLITMLKESDFQDKKIPQTEGEGEVLIPMADLAPLRKSLKRTFECASQIAAVTKLLDYVRQELPTLAKADE